MTKTKILLFIFLLSLFLPTLSANASLSDDAAAYEKFPLFEKYEKKQLYDKYKKFQKIKKKLGFDNPKTKQAAKDGYLKYKLYKKDPAKNKAFAQFLPQYNAYKKYLKYNEDGKYKKYSKYDNDKYEKYKNYDRYESGYNRYKAFMNDISNVTSNLGPEISVALWSYDTADIKEASSAFSITANKIFTITDCGSTNIGEIPLGVSARVTYVDNSEGTLSVYSNDGQISATPVGNSSTPGRICFQAKDGNNADTIFDVNKPNSSYDNYRGKIKIQYSDTSDNRDLYGDATRIWVINTLPLEQYVWGFGEIGGGVEQHSLAMIVTARTYARWYLQPLVTKWNDEGFNLLSTSSSQIYYGYDYEKDHPSIPALAKKTNGVVMHNQDGDIVMAAYSSWTDGRTRKYEDGFFGNICKSSTPGDTSSVYPELSSVSDPYGKHPSSDTCALAAAGNHMVGLSANGSLVLARDYSWSWTQILSYYYSRISIVKEY